MVGYKVMSTDRAVAVLRNRIQPVINLSAGEPSNGFTNPLSYVIDKAKKIIVVISPINATELDTLLNTLANQLDGESISDYHVLLGLVGAGLTEQHIVTTHVPPGNAAIQIFDSKPSHIEKFFSNQVGVAFGKLFTGLFQSLLPAPTEQLEFPYPLQETKRSLDYTVLGTQSFIMDGVSCGYHFVHNLDQCFKLLQADQPITREALLAATGNPVIEVSRELIVDNPDLVNSNFSTFMKQAWQDTFMKGIDDDARQKRNFSHYFMGWPSEEGLGRKVIYFLMLGFIFTPLVNLVKIPTEFLFHAVSEAANYLRNMLISWGPTSIPTQLLRGGLMFFVIGFQALFKGLGLLLGLVTSPVDSATAAWKIHPALGILSGIVSLSAYAALIIFAAPALMGVLGTSFPTLALVVKAIAFPVMKLFSMLGSITPAVATAASALLVTGAAVLATVKSVINRGVDWVTSGTDSLALHDPDVSILSTYGSNVSAALKHVSQPDDLDGDFGFIPVNYSNPLQQTASEEPAVAEVKKAGLDN